MADLIKASWPSAIIYQNEAPGIGDCNYNRMNETVFTERPDGAKVCGLVGLRLVRVRQQQLAPADRGV